MATYIPIVTRGYSRIISLDEVLYFEQRQRKLAIITPDETYIYYERIENLEKVLDERFFHALKKLVINLDKIVRVENQIITFVDGTRLQLARESYIKTKQKYTAYIRNLL
ncbi:MAG: LytTR family transcriptional regulator DNA-binding domain-containing protein [Firmicutes bacterium]|nr:LytTR family transcriptional regulator DNA-binding domain-containing protein [Bacillota bacterium]